jgi:hypothetical protein
MGLQADLPTGRQAIKLSCPPNRTTYQYDKSEIGRSGEVFARHLENFIVT